MAIRRTEALATFASYHGKCNLLIFITALLTLFLVAEASVFKTTAAGIFGSWGQDQSQQDRSDSNKQISFPPPPPPPPRGHNGVHQPPPPPRGTLGGMQQKNQHDFNKIQTDGSGPNQPHNLQPRPNMIAGNGPVPTETQANEMKNPNQQWNETANKAQSLHQLKPPSSSQDSDFNRQESDQYQYDQNYPFYQQYDENQYYYERQQEEARYILQSLEHDLNLSLQREQQLTAQLDNLTFSIAGMEQREKLHIQQLDVLTERVMDVETEKAKDHNEMIELRANCTEQGLQIAVLEGQVEEWRTKCSDLLALHEEDKEKIAGLKKKIKHSEYKAEELAALIEQHRLGEEEGEREIVKKKKRGFFAWLFGFSNYEEEAEDREELYETARSTLLTALQTERNNVLELEAAVTNLQQNNTAIAEQVQSRDLIIEELNDRVTVFEEDKIVLKAALRQLQKDIQDETPKTAKLQQSLKKANKEVERLNKEINELLRQHKSEISRLKTVVKEKEQQIQAIESNLTTIGLYVDKLEERLTDSKVAIRDYDKLEGKYKNAKTNMADLKAACVASESRVRELEEEREEVKKLLEELVQERTHLVKQMNQTSGERDALKKSEQALRQAYSKLSIEARALQAEKSTLQLRCGEYEKEMKANSESTLVKQIERSAADSSELRKQIEKLLAEKQSVEEKLNSTETVRTNLEMQIAHLKANMDEESLKARKAKEMAERADEARRIIEEARKADAARFAEENRKLQETIESEEKKWLAEVEKVEKARIAEEARWSKELKDLEEAKKAEERRWLEEIRMVEETKKIEEKKWMDAVENAEAARKQEEVRRVQEISRAEEALEAEKTRLLHEMKAVAQAKNAEEEKRMEIMKQLEAAEQKALAAAEKVGQLRDLQTTGKSDKSRMTYDQKRGVPSENASRRPLYPSKGNTGNGANGDHIPQVQFKRDVSAKINNATSILSSTGLPVKDDSVPNSTSSISFQQKVNSTLLATKKIPKSATPIPIDQISADIKQYLPSMPLNNSNENSIERGKRIKNSDPSLPPRRDVKAPRQDEDRPSSQTQPRKVPLRKIRKLFSKATGIHGAFSTPSSKTDSPQQIPIRRPPVNSSKHALASGKKTFISKPGKQQNSKTGSGPPAKAHDPKKLPPRSKGTFGPKRPVPKSTNVGRSAHFLAENQGKVDIIPNDKENPNTLIQNNVTKIHSSNTQPESRNQMTEKKTVLE